MRSLPVFFALALAPLQGQMPEVRTTAKDRTALSVTIYQNGLAAIRDTRRVSLPAGPSRLAFSDLLPTLRPKSAVLLDPSRDLQVRERNFEFNLLSPASLADASLGLPVLIKGEDGKPDVPGMLASIPLRKRRLGVIHLGGDPDLPPPPPPPAPPPTEMSEDEIPENEFRPYLASPPSRPSDEGDETLAGSVSEIIVLQPRDPRVLVATQEGYLPTKPSAVRWLSLPRHLRPSPTLSQEVVSRWQGGTRLELMYTAEQFHWTAHYEVTLSRDGRFANLVAFATVANRSGGDLENATLQLVAGEPHLVYDPPPQDPEPPDGVFGGVVGGVAGGVLAGPPIFREEKISEYPLFTLDRPVNLRDQQQKQLPLLRAEEIPVRATFLIGAPIDDFHPDPAYFQGPLFQARPSRKYMGSFEWLQRRSPRVFRFGTVQNTPANHLGRALPKGTLTLRYQDPSGHMVLLPGTGGYSAEFPQTPPGEEIELLLGPARGFQVDRRALDLKVLPAAWIQDQDGKRHPQRFREFEVQVEIRNDMGERAGILVREPLMADWNLVSSTHPGYRSGTNAFDFQVDVPPQGVATLRYRARTAVERGTALVN